jgi:hypothetical protein
MSCFFGDPDSIRCLFAGGSRASGPEVGAVVDDAEAALAGGSEAIERRL